MTTKRWLQMASAIAMLALLFMLGVIWRNAADERAQAEDVGARAEAVMDRIEAEAGRLENAAR